jgi:pyridoxamine 5'-phosphate oxidase
MQRDLQNLRKSYEKAELIEKDLPNNPIVLFDHWFDLAKNCEEIEEANAMNLATLGQDGFPKSRVVLLKEIDNGNLIFYTNYTSEKARSIDHHTQVSINFFWPALEKQVIIKATAAKVSREKSADYFNSRPRGSRIGAWVSHQSSEIQSREALDEQLFEIENRFKDQQVPLPDFWGGFECGPVSFEFWQGRENRLHDRILYEKLNGSWVTKRLQP